MDRKITNENFPPEISLEEFDMIDVSEERHEFSERYRERKDAEMRAYRKRMLGFNRKQYFKVAAAAVLITIATPFAVNAATNGELFQRLWGNSGKQNIESHEETFVEEEKIDENGNSSEYTVTFPSVEYEAVDEELAEELIGENISTEPVTIPMGDTTMTVTSVTRDGIGIVAEYTLEKEGGVDCLNYSELDNQMKGAWLNEDQTINFGFNEGSGKIFVDLEKSTADKLYCYEYMADNSALFGEGFSPIDDHITLWSAEYTKPLSEIYADENANVDDFLKEENNTEIPVAEKIATTTFANSEGGEISISPIAMQLKSDIGLGLGEEEYDYPMDLITAIKITYKDGSVYEVDTPDYANYAYICGNEDGIITLFNRLVDTENIEKITINETDYTLK